MELKWSSKEIQLLLDKKVSVDEIKEIIELSGGSHSKLKCLIARKLFGEPNAYLRGNISFFGNIFKIDRRSYIPDNYAINLVKYAIEYIPNNCSVLDIDTGCSWIGLTLKLKRPDLNIFAADIDPGAISLALENASSHGISLKIYECYHSGLLV